jgi:dolichyl-phosphate beta-glucosyltransferase
MPADFLLSIVIPAYNEEQRLPDSLAQLRAYASQQLYSMEVLVVDDGSEDTTAAVVEAAAANWPDLRLLHIAHTGKGQAIKQGLLAARGDLIFICDADLSMPIEQLARFITLMQDGSQVVIGSREAPGAVRYGEPALRHLMGRVFNWLVRHLVLPGIQDSQCGFKCFTREVARDLASCQQLTGWGFDVELLSIARTRGYNIQELPISWYYKASSRIHPLRDTIHMTHDLFTVRRNHRVGRYERIPEPESALSPGNQ